MIFVLIACIIAGAISAGLNLIPAEIVNSGTIITEYFLYFLLVMIGIDLGNNRSSLRTIFKADRFTLIVPLGTILGTLFGGYLASFLISLSVKDSMAIASGFGWYSFSAVILAKERGADIGSIAFLTNVMRESMSFIFIPLIAKHINVFASVAPGGATTMDVTLPIIEKYAGKRIAVIGFVQGVILTGITPFVIPLFI